MTTKVPTEKEMIEKIEKNPRIKQVFGALREIVPEAVLEVEKRRKRESIGSR